ncbi:MAG: phosphatidate cytidylyltransferase [Acidobacteria bacterium]|nr:phosphatidate cytidylyltransferase [Acidobacteriota bacterium]
MLARTIVSLILAPVALAVLFLAPPLLFTLAVLLVAQFSFIEYLQLVPILGDRKRQFWLTTLSGVVVLAFAFASQSTSTICLVLLAVLLGVIIQALWSVTHMDQVLPAIATSIFGLMYIPMSLGLMILLRSHRGDSGRRWILFLLLVTWASDIGAYLVGRSLGRHKLSPSISPGKTIEGSLAGLASALLVGLAFFRSAGNWHWLAMAVILNVVGQCGDLFESTLKRAAGVKDSSDRIPGHGGFLDRVDSLLFCCPVLYVMEGWRW